MIRKVFFLFTFALLIQRLQSTTSSYSFQRVLQCVSHINETCYKWNEHTILIENKTSTFSCFPGDRYLLTPQGPEQMDKIRIGDKVWSKDLETNEDRFSTVIGWLHRDQKAESKFKIINTIDGLQFYSSGSHNIGVFGQTGRYGFKFASQLTITDRVVLNGQHSQEVKSVEQSDWKRGLYSPFTEHGTFYIFHSGFQVESFDTMDEPMILAHCLSQIRDPQEVVYLFKSIIGFTYRMRLNSQPKSTERYVHPIIRNFKFMFKNWYEQHTITRYNLPSTRSRELSIAQVENTKTIPAELKQSDTSSDTTTEQDTTRLTEMIILNGMLLQITLML